jgi:hypothetical protein
MIVLSFYWYSGILLVFFLFVFAAKCWRFSVHAIQWLAHINYLRSENMEAKLHSLPRSHTDIYSIIKIEKNKQTRIKPFQTMYQSQDKWSCSYHT